jgi:hypothetical protein
LRKHEKNRAIWKFYGYAICGFFTILGAQKKLEMEIVTQLSRTQDTSC